MYLFVVYFGPLLYVAVPIENCEAMINYLMITAFVIEHEGPAPLMIRLALGQYLEPVQSIGLTTPHTQS
jgi:hypothetical protein